MYFFTRVKDRTGLPDQFKVSIPYFSPLLKLNRSWFQPEKGFYRAWSPIVETQCKKSKNTRDTYGMKWNKFEYCYLQLG